MIIGLSGVKGCGKDTLAAYLAQHHGFTRLAFADALYDEVAEAFGVPRAWLELRETKETPTRALAVRRCDEAEFGSSLRRDICRRWPRSPRQILQWWGTEYRRAQDPEYWLKRFTAALSAGNVVVPDVRFENEGQMILDLGGELLQITRAGLAPSADAHSSEHAWRGLPFLATIENVEGAPKHMCCATSFVLGERTKR